MLLLVAVLFLISVQFVSSQEKDPRCPPFNEGLVVHLPHEYDCTKFYKCDWGFPILFDCQPGTHWSIATDRCEFPEEANCELGLSTTSSTTSRPLDPRCPLVEDPRNPVHLPHEYDCTKFYKCNWGVPELFDCMPGTHWSIELDRCDWPNIANCTLSGSSTAVTSPVTTTSTSTTSTTPTSTITSTTTLSTTTSNPGGLKCPDDDDPFENPVFLPHEYDCRLFYMCFFGEFLLYECSTPGTHWSVELNSCEEPEIANCQLGSTTEASTTSSTSTSTTTVEPRDPRCPLNDDPNNPVYLPHESDCSLFYVCDDGQVVLYECSDRNHWSVILNRCEWPAIAECDASIEIDERCPMEDGLTFLPHEIDCNKFYACNRGVIELNTCDIGLHWNALLNRCDYPESAYCKLVETTTELTTITTTTALMTTEPPTTVTIPTTLSTTTVTEPPTTVTTSTEMTTVTTLPTTEATTETTTLTTPPTTELTTTTVLITETQELTVGTRPTVSETPETAPTVVPAPTSPFSLRDLPIDLKFVN